jgi:hypothetical protein
METKYDKDGKEYAVNKELRFIDSFKFMASSLSSLLKNVKEFPHLSHFYQGEQLELLLKKGFILTSGSIHLSDSMRPNFHLRRRSILS